MEVAKKTARKMHRHRGRSFSTYGSRFFKRTKHDKFVDRKLTKSARRREDQSELLLGVAEVPDPIDAFYERMRDPY